MPHYHVFNEDDDEFSHLISALQKFKTQNYKNYNENRLFTPLQHSARYRTPRVGDVYDQLAPSE